MKILSNFKSNEVINFIAVIGILCIAFFILGIYAFKSEINEALTNVVVSIVSGLIGFLSRGSNRTSPEQDSVTPSEEKPNEEN